MDRTRLEITSAIENQLPVKAKLNTGTLICKDKRSLAQIKESMSDSGEYINFHNTSTWKTITGFAGNEHSIFVKIVKFNKLKVKIRETLYLPDPENGYRRIQGEAYNLIEAKAAGLKCPNILGIITHRYWGLNQEQHLIIESFPNHENLNEALSNKSIRTEEALKVVDNTIMDLYQLGFVHLDFHMDNILVNTNGSQDFDYKIIDLEFFDFLSKASNYDSISWHLAQVFQNKEKNTISSDRFDKFSYEVLQREIKQRDELEQQIEKYNYWKSSTLKRERFWYKAKQA